MPALSSYPPSEPMPGVDKVLLIDDAGVAALDDADLDGTEYALVERAGVGYRVPVTAFGLGAAVVRPPLSVGLARAPGGDLPPGQALTLTATPAGARGPYAVRFFADGAAFGQNHATTAGGSASVTIPVQSRSVTYKAVATSADGDVAEASVTVTPDPEAPAQGGVTVTDNGDYFTLNGPVTDGGGHLIL